MPACIISVKAPHLCALMPKDTFGSRNTQAVLLNPACMPVNVGHDQGVRFVQSMCGQALPAAVDTLVTEHAQPAKGLWGEALPSEVPSQHHSILHC